MLYSLDLYSTQKEQIDSFFKSFYNNKLDFSNYWNYSIHKNNNQVLHLYKRRTKNPIDFIVLLGVLVDNSNKFDINTWLSLDNDTYINITSENIDLIIKYIYERFPY